MNKVLLVAVQELVVNLRRPGFIIMTLLVPVLGLVVLLVGSLFGGQVGQVLESQFAPSAGALGYVDQSGLLFADLPQYAGRFVRYADEPSARADLLAKKIDNYFLVPADYLQSGQVVLYGAKGGFSTMTAAEGSGLQSFLADHLLAGKVDSAIQARVSTPPDVKAVTLDTSGEVTSGSPFSWVGDFVLPYLFSILFIITLFSTSGFLLQGVAEEKEGRIVEILVSSISPTQLLAGKILGLGTLGLIQVGVWIGSAAALMALATAAFAVAGLVKISGTLVALGVVYFVLGYLLYATLMAATGSLGTTERESQQLAGIFSLGAAIPFMLVGVMFSNPDAPIVIAFSFFPLTSPVMMLLRLGFSQVPAEQIAVSLILLVAGIAVSLWAGAKVFRMGILMYGKRPALKDLWLTFKQA
jgi:ABC-2 type transport system permease protein